MLVLAALPRSQYARLHLAVATDFELLFAPTWQIALEAIQTRPVEITVLDPLLSGRPRIQELDRIRGMFPSLPIVLYTRFTTASAGLLLELGRRDIRRVIFVRHDDHPARLKETLRFESEHSVAQRLIDDLSDLFDGLPLSIKWALEAALADPADLQTVDALADRSEVDRRTCQRWFSRAGLVAPHLVLNAARVLHAHALLQDPGYTVDNVAQRLGYGHVKTLQHHTREILALPPAELRLSMSREEALSAVRGYITRGDAVADGRRVS